MSDPEDDPSTWPIHPDLDPAKPYILVELDRLVDRMIRLAPDRGKAIVAAARRLERALVSTDRETTGQEGNKGKGERSNMRMLEILLDLMAQNEEGRESNIGLHSPDAARRCMRR
jgi:hypothetical protein